MSAEDLIGQWVPTPDGGVGQVWAVAGCRAKTVPVIEVIVIAQPPFPVSVGGSRCQMGCRCKPAVWVADGHAWHLVPVADIQRAPIGATA